MKKIQYEIVYLEVDKMYPPHYVLKPNESVDEHLLFIEDYIRSCGWDVDEFMNEFNHRTLLSISPPTN